MKKFVLPAFAIAVLAGCSGGGTGPVARPTTAAGTVPVSVTIKWPNPGVSSTARHRAYVSNGTKSITISVDGGTPASTDNPNLAPGAANAPTQTTTVTIVLAPGSHSFAIADYDATGGGGNLLARTTVQSTVTIDQANVISATLDGNLASIDEQAVPNAYLTNAKPIYTVVGPATQTFNLIPLDASGNIIVSPGALPAISTTSATPASVSVTPNATTNQISVNALAAEASVVLTAAGTNLLGTAVTHAFTVKTLGALFVCDQQNFQLKVFDENGNQITTPGGFPGLYACIGVTYVPPTANAPGTIYVSDNGSTGSGPYVHPFDLLGNPVGLPSGGFTAVKDTSFWRYFPALQDFYIPGGNKASIYDVDGNFLSYFQPSAFTGIDFDPTGNANAGEIFVTGNAKVIGMTTAGTVLGTTANNAVTGNPPFTQGSGIVYDANKGNIFVAGLDGTTGYGTVLEFTPALAAVTHTPNTFTDLTNPAAPGIPYPAGIAFDPANKEFYVTNYRAKTGVNTQTAMYVFTEAGAAATNVVTGGFANLNEPGDLIFLP